MSPQSRLSAIVNHMRLLSRWLVLALLLALLMLPFATFFRPESAVQVQSRHIRGILQPRNDLPPDTRVSLSLTTMGFAQAKGIVSELTGRKILPNECGFTERLDDLLHGKLTRLHLVQRKPPVDSGIRLHRDGAYTPAEVLKIANDFFSTNGVTLLPVGAKYYRLLEGDSCRGQANASSG